MFCNFFFVMKWASLFVFVFHADILLALVEEFVFFPILLPPWSFVHFWNFLFIVRNKNDNWAQLFVYKFRLKFSDVTSCHMIKVILSLATTYWPECMERVIKNTCVCVYAVIRDMNFELWRNNLNYMTGCDVTKF